MEKTFQFVDSSAKVDRVTRKLIRSHVMKGKNAGKTVHRRSRLELGAGRTPCGDASLPNGEARKRNAEELGPVARNLGNVLRTFQFPVELSENSLKIINQCKCGSLFMNQLKVTTETCYPKFSSS
jgi:hypothetical protein